MFQTRGKRNQHKKQSTDRGNKMTPQFKLGISVGLIACLLAMALLPTETESTPVGWVAYGIIIGLLLGVALRAFSIISYQTSYKGRKTYNTRSR